MGFTTRSIDNMAGFVEFGKGKKMVAALGHLDVVPPGDGWTGDPFIPVVTEARIVARGAIDDKGPVIACLFAMKALRAAGYEPPARIRLIVGLDEESGSSCMARYTRTEELPAAGFTPDASFPAIYAEKGILHLVFRMEEPVVLHCPGGPVALQVCGGDRANVVPSRCSVNVTMGTETALSQVFAGVPAHGSTPDQGANAIAPAMDAVAKWLASQELSHPFVDFFNRRIGRETDGHSLGIACTDEPSGALTFNAGVVEMDEDRTELVADIRYPVTADREDLLAKMRAVAAPYGISVAVQSSQQPLHLDPASPTVATLTRIYREVTGRTEKPLSIGGGTYARSMPNIVAYGPGVEGEPEMAHKADEYMTLERLETCVRIYARALAGLAAAVAE
jgi:succinyl-diaminopimelate desuccinylase